MGLLGKLFGGGKKGDKRPTGRSKRGRAPSIRQIPAEAESTEPAQQAPLPEINLDDIEQQQAAAPAAPAAPAEGESFDPVPADFKGPEAPAPAPMPAASEAPSAPPKTTSRRKTATASSPSGRSARRSTRLQSRQKPLGEILIQAEAVSTEQLSRALKIQEKGGKGLVGQILVNMGACQSLAVATGLGRQFRISTIELDHIEIRAEAAALVPQDKCSEHRLIPFEKLGKLICVAMANCLNRKAINEIEELTKLKVKPFNCSWIEIREAIENVYSQDAVQKAAAVQAQAAAEKVAAEVAGEPAGDAPLAIEDIVLPEAAAAEEDEELRPFTGPAKAVIEGLDDLDAGDAEEVKTTERGLASRHLEARQARREERQKVMGTGKGVVGKLIAPDLDKFSPDQFGDAPEVIDLRQVDESVLADVELPVAKVLADSVTAFADKTAPAAPPPEVAPAEEATTVIEAPAPAPAEGPDLVEIEAAHDHEAEHQAEPQVDTVAAAETVADELPAAPSIDHTPEEPQVVAAVALSDEEWADMEADYEPDPVVAWNATYASAGPVVVREAFL